MHWVWSDDELIWSQLTCPLQIGMWRDGNLMWIMRQQFVWLFRCGPELIYMCLEVYIETHEFVVFDLTRYVHTKDVCKWIAMCDFERCWSGFVDFTYFICIRRWVKVGDIIDEQSIYYQAIGFTALKQRTGIVRSWAHDVNLRSRVRNEEITLCHSRGACLMP